MRIEDRISKEQKQQLQKMKSPKKERLSEREIKHLMGMDKQIYTRKHGSIRNK